jgi:hypothetical protein
MKQSRTGKLSSWRQTSSDIELIPPNAEEFGHSIWGGGAEQEAAARLWALDHHYMLVDGVARCAHGLLGFRTCPASCSRIGDFDHANVWAYVDRLPFDIFILSAPYFKEPSPELFMYAEHHGLRIDYGPALAPLGDGWYGGRTIPIRAAFPESRTHMNPLEELLLVLSHAAPTEWPARPDERESRPLALA